jgi:PAS domain S-box-containing protein
MQWNKFSPMGVMPNWNCEGTFLSNLSEMEPNASERYSLLVDAITDYAIFMLDPNGTVVSWNSGAQRFKGYSKTEILGKHFSRFYMPEDRERGLPGKALETAAQEGRFEGEGWRVRKDGSKFWAHVVIEPIRLSEGTLAGFAKITRDLTERKAAADGLVKSEQQFRSLVQGVTDYAIYMMDTEGHVSSWNAGAQRIKGYRPEEVIGQHFSCFFREEDQTAEVPLRALETARREGRYESEGWRSRKDGSEFWANAVIDAIRNDDGELIGFAKITRDVTEKREAQRALDIAREELFQAQKMEAVGQLTGGIAHDFNNLLMAIQGSLELLRKRMSLTPEAELLLGNALRATQRGASLTQRMLAFSRRQDLHFEAVDLLDLVRGMTDMLQRSIGPAIVIETRFPLSLPQALTDPNQLANAILNLTINARDAMPQGGVLTIGAKIGADARSSHLDLGEGDYVCLYLQDSGEGMDAETLINATTPFFTTKGVGKGTGLGLPMVQGLMAQSNGKLVLRSSKGYGTTAELWLPVAQAEPPIAATPGLPEIVMTVPKTLTILAVDDDPLVLMNTVMMLEDMGHTVLEAISGSQALEMMAERSIDLVITDHAMPRMTGSQLADAIRTQWPDIPILLATGYAELPPGANPDLLRLSKPFTELQLQQAVQNVMHEAAIVPRPAPFLR